VPQETREVMVPASVAQRVVRVFQVIQSVVQQRGYVVKTMQTLFLDNFL